MPRVRYVLKETGIEETFWEDDILPKGYPLDARIKAYLEKRPEKNWELVRVDIRNHWEHEHSWVTYRDHKITANRDWIRCRICGVMAKKYPNSKVIDRDPEFKEDKYEICREAPVIPKKPKWK